MTTAGRRSRHAGKTPEPEDVAVMPASIIHVGKIKRRSASAADRLYFTGQLCYACGGGSFTAGCIIPRMEWSFFLFHRYQVRESPRNLTNIQAIGIRRACFIRSPSLLRLNAVIKTERERKNALFSLSPLTLYALSVTVTPVQVYRRDAVFRLHLALLPGKGSLQPFALASIFVDRACRSFSGQFALLYCIFETGSWPTNDRPVEVFKCHIAV